MTHRQPFIILALPRSRTAWLSHFLSYGGHWCGHDISIESDSISDFWRRLHLLSGTVETGAALTWRLMIAKVRVVVVRRAEVDVVRSLDALGLAGRADEIEQRAAFLDEASGWPGVVTIPYPTLEKEEVCAWLFEYCLGEAFNKVWWESIATRNIQIDIAACVRRIAERGVQIAALKQEIHRELADA